MDKLPLGLLTGEVEASEDSREGNVPRDLCWPFPQEPRLAKTPPFQLLCTHYSGLGNISKLDRH